MNAPDGWRLVPVEPTEAMLYAMRIAHMPQEMSNGRAAILYRAMLAAAPVPPTGGNGEWSEGQIERACEAYYNAQGLKGKRAWADVYWVAKDEYRDWMRAALSSLTPACATTGEGQGMPDAVRKVIEEIRLNTELDEIPGRDALRMADALESAYKRGGA